MLCCMRLLLLLLLLLLMLLLAAGCVGRLVGCLGASIGSWRGLVSRQPATAASVLRRCWVGPVRKAQLRFLQQLCRCRHDIIAGLATIRGMCSVRPPLGIANRESSRDHMINDTLNIIALCRPLAR